MVVLVLVYISRSIFEYLFDVTGTYLFLILTKEIIQYFLFLWGKFQIIPYFFTIQSSINRIY